VGLKGRLGRDSCRNFAVENRAYFGEDVGRMAFAQTVDFLQTQAQDLAGVEAQALYRHAGRRRAGEVAVRDDFDLS
jgi:hypothetical protein